MKDRLVLFITDKGFLIPTISAALQVAAQPRVTELADIMIYLIDIGEGDVEALRRALQDMPIRFESLSSQVFSPPEGTVFHKTHVPMATLARLSISEHLPSQYRHIIYLDGDIQIVGDIHPLVSHTVAEGRMLAACDAMWVYDGDSGPYWRGVKDYLAGIGISDPCDYFNAGVLAARREAWTEICNDARAYYFANSGKCLYHDQSALNAVCVGRREVLSPAFNFISNYADFVDLEKQDLRIIHFTGAAKPWFYAGAPWNGRFLLGYQQLINRYPVLQKFVRATSRTDIRNIERINRKKRWRTTILAPWRKPMRRRRFLAYCQTTAFSV